MNLIFSLKMAQMSDPLYKYMHYGSNGDWMVSQTMIKIRHGFVWGKYLLFYFWTVELISVKIIFNSKYKFMHVAMVFKEFNWRVYLKDSSLNWNILKFACAVIADKHYKLLSPKNFWELGTIESTLLYL